MTGFAAHPFRRPASITVCLTLFCVLSVASNRTYAQLPCLRWSEVISAGSPGPRFGHAMAYDRDRGVTVLFGGAPDLIDNHLSDNETWEYDGVAWKVIPITGSKPSSRFFHDMVYDPIRREIVMFGGTQDGLNQNGETWTYRSDGSVGTWTRRFPATIPRGYDVYLPAPGFFQHKMVFDSASGLVVLLGGTFFIRDAPISPDDWESNDGRWVWNGLNWQDPFYPGLARSGHAVAFDDKRGTTVLFGGIKLDLNGNNLGLQGGTWESSNGAWTQAAGSTPALRSGHTMAYDDRRNKVVMFGGGDAAVSDDTDEYTAGVGWSSLLDSGPPGRVNHAMVYDSRRGVMVIYGGWSNAGNAAYGDTWELDVCTRPPDAVRWVEFAYIGPESGSFTAPFNTLSEGTDNVPIGGTLKIKAGISPERLAISKAMTISAYGGSATIGQ